MYLYVPDTNKYVFTKTNLYFPVIIYTKSQKYLMPSACNYMLKLNNKFKEQICIIVIFS